MNGTANPSFDAREAHFNVYLFVPRALGMALSCRPPLESTEFRLPVLMVVALASSGVRTKLLSVELKATPDRGAPLTSALDVVRAPRTALLVGTATVVGVEYSNVPSAAVSTPNVAVFVVNVLKTSHWMGAPTGMGAPAPVWSVFTVGVGPAFGLNRVCCVSSNVTVTGLPDTMLVTSNHADCGTFRGGKGLHSDGVV